MISGRTCWRRHGTRPWVSNARRLLAKSANKEIVNRQLVNTYSIYRKSSKNHTWSTYRKQNYSVNNHLGKEESPKNGDDGGGLQPVHRFFLIIKGKALWTRLGKREAKTSITRSLSRYPIHEVKVKKCANKESKQSSSIITNLPGRFLHAAWTLLFPKFNKEKHQVTYREDRQDKLFVS